MSLKERIFIDTNDYFAENEYFVGQKEQRFHSNDQLINNQIESQLSTLNHIFSWISFDQIQELRSQILSQIKSTQQTVKTKYITTAYCYNLIKNTSGINETESIQQLLSAFNVKSRKLLKYLSIIKDEDKEDFDKLLQQIPYYQSVLRKYFFGQGQCLLLKLKKPNQQYTQLIEEIIENNKKIMMTLYRFQQVKQFCVSKRPSRLVINLGYCAFQFQQIFLLPGEYARIFRMSINSLRHFYKGLINVMYQFVMKITTNEKQKNENQNSQFSETMTNELDILKKTEDSSISEQNMEIECYKLQVIRKFMEDFSTYLFLFIDTSEEDDLFMECEKILNE